MAFREFCHHVGQTQLVKAFVGIDEEIAVRPEPLEHVDCFDQRRILDDHKPSGSRIGSRSLISLSSMRQNDTTGEPVRSEPKLGNACACLPSRNAATESNSAAVTTPWPPRPCMRTWNMRCTRSRGRISAVAHRDCFDLAQTPSYIFRRRFPIEASPLWTSSL